MTCCASSPPSTERATRGDRRWGMPMWATFRSRHACNDGSCWRSWHAARMCTRAHVCHYSAHNIAIDSGLMVRAVDLAVHKIRTIVLVRWETLCGVTSGCTHTQTKRVHSAPKDAVHIKLISWHAICFCFLEMRGRSVHSETCVHSYTQVHVLQVSGQEKLLL
jgi:hypothetical protein